MKVADLLESRRQNWRLLEQMCGQMEGRKRRTLGASGLTRFASLYRAACADLALADAYQLPPNTVAYLHTLVGRAHNQLYRSRRFNFAAWGREMFHDAPQRLFADNSLRLAFCMFWGFFVAAMFLSSEHSPIPDFDQRVLGEEGIAGLENMYAEPIAGRGEAGFEEFNMSAQAGGFYLNHNTSIGLKVFAAGLLFGIGGLFATIFNAVFLGAAFGHMTKTEYWDNFSTFVTAHGPFELTAIVLSAAAGMKLGFALIDTGGLSRVKALEMAGREAMPTMGAAIVLFFFAALIEGFLSPSAAPYLLKAAVAVASTALLMFYFVLLGYPREAARATR